MNQYAAGILGGSSLPALGLAIMPALKQRLETAILRAEERLRAVKEAKEIFDRNSDLERFLNIMQEGLF